MNWPSEIDFSSSVNVRREPPWDVCELSRGSRYLARCEPSMLSGELPATCRNRLLSSTSNAWSRSSTSIELSFRIICSTTARCVRLLFRPISKRVEPPTSDSAGNLIRFGLETLTSLNFCAKFWLVRASKTGVFFSIFSLPTVRPNFLMMP